MALSKLQAESLNLADTYTFTGTVSGAGGGVDTSTAVAKGSASINVLGGLNKAWWHENDDSFNISSYTDANTYAHVTFTNTMDSNKWTCTFSSEEKETLVVLFGGFETTTQCYYRFWRPHYGNAGSPSDVMAILTGDLA